MPCCKGTQCWVVSSHSRFGHIFLYSCACPDLGPSGGGNVYGLFSKEALDNGKASVSRTHSPSLAARLTEHIRCLYRPGLKDANKPRYRLLRRKLWRVRSLPLAIFYTISHTLAAEALAISMEAPMGNARVLRKSDACGARERTPRSVRLGEGCRVGGVEKGGHGRVCGVVLLPRKLFQAGPESNQFSFQECWGWTFLLLLSTQLRYGKIMRIVVLKVLFICLISVGWGCSRRIVRKIRTVQTFRGSGCRGARWEVPSYLHGACKHVSEFLRLPSRQCSASQGSGTSPPISFPTTYEEFHIFQLPSVIANVGTVKRRFHEVVGGMRCGPPRRWVQAQLEVGQAGGKRWLQFFSGKRALRHVPESSCIGTSNTLPMRWRCAACVPCQESGGPCHKPQLQHRNTTTATTQPPQEGIGPNTLVFSV